MRRRSRARRVLFVPMKDFPSDHAALECIYSRELPRFEYRVTWLMRGPAGRRVRRWNRSAAIVMHRPKGGLVARAGSWSRLLVALGCLAATRRFETIIVRNSLTAAGLALILRPLFRHRLVYQFSFPVAESLLAAVSTGRTRTRLPQMILGGLQKAARRRILARADLVLAISDEMKRQLLAAGVGADRILVQPLGYENLPRPSAAEIAETRRALELGAAPTVIYFGAVAPERDLEFLLDVASIVSGEIPDCRWIVLGPSREGEAERLRSEAERRGIATSFRFVPRVARKEVARYIAAADVSVSPVPTIPLFWLSSPTKTIEALGLDVPVVATDIPDQAEIVGLSGGGLVTTYDRERFAAAVIHLLRSADERLAMGRRGGEYVRKMRDYGVLASRMADRLADLRSR